MGRPKQRTEELRDHVLDTALQLLAQEGVAGFTTRTIAREARTSTPAVYELFGDKGGLVREVYFEGFRRLRRALEQVEQSADPRGDLIDLVTAYRGFMRANPVLAEVMFSQPFTEFQPRPEQLRAASSVRILIVARVRRCIEAGLLVGDETDIAHVLVALTQGLAAAENAKRLGRSRASVERRWRLAVEALLDGLGS